MSDQNPTQQVREQFKVAETMVQNGVRAWNEIAVTVTELTFDATEKGLRYTQDALQTYRRMYQDGLKTWQGYVQGVSDTFTRQN